jgi:hypothetical protein
LGSDLLFISDNCAESNSDLSARLLVGSGTTADSDGTVSALSSQLCSEGNDSGLIDFDSLVTSNSNVEVELGLLSALGNVAIV